MEAPPATNGRAIAKPGNVGGSPFVSLTMRWRILLWPLGVTLAFFVDRLATSPWVPFLAALWMMHAAVPRHRANDRIELTGAACLTPLIAVGSVLIIGLVRLLGLEAIWLFKVAVFATALLTLSELVKRVSNRKKEPHQKSVVEGHRPVGPIVQTARSRRKTPEP
ncbi:MAG: hypothetical protein K1X67_24990 [Fimbriimonadaceae bacterium]|nr:hypothetical protein [Fimbriimonadaceae bacterium]